MNQGGLIDEMGRPVEESGLTVQDETPAEEGGERIGVFPGWGWLYAAVVVYTVLLILSLYLFTLLADHRLQ